MHSIISGNGLSRNSHLPTITKHLYLAPRLWGNPHALLFQHPIIPIPARIPMPQIRWLFSHGWHIFPQAAVLSSAGFAYLAFAVLRPGQAASQLFKAASNGGKGQWLTRCCGVEFQYRAVYEAGYDTHETLS